MGSGVDGALVALGILGGCALALVAALGIVRGADTLRRVLAEHKADEADRADRAELMALGAREDADVVAEAERITRDAPPPPPPAAGPGRWPTG